MRPHPLPLYVLFSLVLAGTLALSGCSDIVSVDPADQETVVSGGPIAEVGPGGKGPVSGRDIAAWGRQIQARSNKARHFHLLDRAYRPGKSGSAPGHGRKLRASLMAAGGGASADSVRLIMGTKSGATADSVLQIIIDKYKIFNRFEYKTALRGRAITLAANDLDSFMADVDTTSAVEWTEPDAVVPTGTGGTGATPVSTQQLPWAITDIGADLSSTASGDGAGLVDVDLYVLDTGAEGADIDVVECLEFTRRDGAIPCASTADPDGHGTSVASVAAARDNAAGIVGVAPGARVRVVKALRENGNTPIGALVAIVDYLTARKLASPSVPMVVNISMGADMKTTRYNGLDEAIQASIAAGVVYVLAAGNDGIDAGRVSPAHVPEAITVGAYDQSGSFASFSNYGAVVDVLAPGVDVPALTPQGELVHTSGTSLAAPYVAGAAALLLSQEPTLTPAEVRDRIVSNGQSRIAGAPALTTDAALLVAW